ncbi:ABC transporter permease [Pseudoxanthomonas sacheonensis]|uniref:Sodium transport system permease protein n=1 Tax=Pseudoxanthomonas sacheonensis TaxID=443615 RepID=A0ABU1RV56_9GAMM|nr:ABC transporter permease [Pseudoxanthomonas sacheonensis]MDR6841805.1 sodium transport system permease protein [Pseudoxanthomonas sacheonensis]
MKSLRALMTVMRKELRDIFRDRRTLLLALGLSPLLTPLLIIGLGTLGESRARSQTEKPLELPVVGREHAPNLVAWLEGQNVVIKTPPKDINAAIANQEEDVILRIGPEFPEQWRKSLPAPLEIIQDSTRQDAEIPVRRLRGLLDAYGGQTGALRLLARGISPGTATALQVRQTDLATPEAQRGRLLSFILPYFLIISAFLGGVSLILDATAGERERQSLEPLLATPAPRGAIVSGKIAAACVIALISLLLTLLAFKLGALLSPSVGRQMEVSFMAIAKLLLILVPMVFIGTTLLTYLAAAAKSMKEAQSHMTWLMLLPMLPTIVLMVNPVKTQLWQFAVPFLAQNQLILKVVRGEVITAQQWAVYLATGFGLAAILWFAATRRYQQERLAISG